MQLRGNTILITGGGSGIGLAMAAEFKERGNTVIVAGRSEQKLAAAAAKGFATFQVDMSDAKSIQALASKVIQEFPNLNVVIHSAGIMKNENVLKNRNQMVQDETVFTNLLGPIRLTDALLPHFQKQESAAIMTVTSGLGYVPLALTPTYSATKAAIHSYTQSLRYQLRDTKIQVVELAPPYVQTELMGQRQVNDPNAMPLKDFISEVFQILKDQPDVKEIMVKRVLPQRYAGSVDQAGYQDFFTQFNDRMLAARKEEFNA